MASIGATVGACSGNAAASYARLANQYSPGVVAGQYRPAVDASGQAASASSPQTASDGADQPFNQTASARPSPSPQAQASRATAHSAAQTYAQTSAQASSQGSPPPANAMLVTKSYGFRLGPLGFEYSSKEVAFGPAAADAALNQTAAADAQDSRMAQDLTDDPPSSGFKPGPEISIRPRGLAAYAQSALGASNPGRRGEVYAVV